MSDNVKDLEKKYEKNVFLEQHPRSIGLFTIPEYPEFESERGMWSAALEAILTTLRYLAPATLLTLFWGQQSFLFKILKHIDTAFRAIVFSSEEQKQAVLQWLGEAGPARVEHLETVWRHGWIVCGVLDAALPGACAGHPPTRLSLKHAQAIADHYLGVEPVFSRQELESNDSLSRHQEWKLATYLDRIRQALAKITPPVSKPISQRTSPETTQFTLDYIAKGSGLSAAQLNNKMYFKIYPTAQQSLDPGEITILIRGPRDTYGMTVLPPILGKAQMIRQKLLGLQSKQNYTENALPITQGTAYLRSYGKHDMNKTYYIPKSKYDIEIDVEARADHAKISYVVNLEGQYEISITSRGQSIVGSPFTVTGSNNIIGILEKENFCLEDGEEIDIVDVKTDRKVVLRIVDFVTEKMLLKENGSLEKISEDEAKILMATDSENETSNQDSDICDSSAKQYFKEKSNKFNKVAQKVLKLNRVCKIMNNLVENQTTNKTDSMEKDKTYNRPRSQQDIPDIVNSTFTESNANPFMLPEKRDKFIIPESISVSLRTEKSKCFYEERVSNTTIEVEEVAANVFAGSSSSNNSPDSIENYNTSQGHQLEDDNISIDRMTPLSVLNPFLSDICEETLMSEKQLGVFVASEYETNNLQNEETQDASIKIIIDASCTPSMSPSSNNPFIGEDIKNIERPKTPVFKIISGEKTNRDDSVYVERKSELIPEDMLGNEFINPFFVHHHHPSPHEQLPITDFIIGAPVSLPPIITAPSPEPDMKSLVIAPHHNEMDTHKFKQKHNPVSKEQAMSPLLFSASLPTNSVKPKTEVDSASSTLHSLESDLTETIGISNASTTYSQYEPYRRESLRSERNLSPRKDTWDSAYVSIDDNSSPDNNNNENTTLYETISKQKFSLSDDNFGLNPEELSNMGPAEREIWQTCNELNELKPEEEIKPNRWERRPIFTPIIEENERSISSGTKNVSRSEKHSETDHITVAFAELNDLYTEYFPSSESISIRAAAEDNTLHSTEEHYTIETNEYSVDSASEGSSDVKRHEKKLEGSISEVQTNAAESVSVSQTLPDETNCQSKEYPCHYNDEIQFGDSKGSNIVLERKIYWDEKIRQIETKSQETTMLQKKRKISLKQLKNNDSLSKRRGKQIVKNFLNAGGYNKTNNAKQIDIKQTDIIKDTQQFSDEQDSTVQIKGDKKLVGKWKKYWDDRLEKEHDACESVSVRASLKTKEQFILPHLKAASPSNDNVERSLEINVENNDSNVLSSPVPVKQELPEEVFKAFETSPKRFFGRSRKQILNKIDIFLGSPSISDESSPEVIDGSHDSGLVSSRISLFHNLSNTEELPWSKRKCKSMHNIYERKDAIKSVASVEIQPFVEQDNDNLSEALKKQVSRKSSSENDSVNVSLIDKKPNISDKINNRSCDDDVACHKIVEEGNTSDKSNIYVKRTNKDFTIQNSHTEKYTNSEVLRRTSISKSEMDIFNKVPSEPADDYLDKYKSFDELPKTNVKNFISLYESVSKTTVESKPVKRIYRTSSVDSEKLMQTISKKSDAVKKLETTNQGIVEDVRPLSSEPKSRLLKTLPGKLKIYQSSISGGCIETKTERGCINIEAKTDQDKETTYLSLSDIELEIVENSPDKTSESSPEGMPVEAHIEYKNRFKSAKQYFQSLEELREIKKPRKLNECELLLNKSTESLDYDRPQKRVKKKLKSHSMPSSEISKIWSQLQENQQQEDVEVTSTKLVKISEKFNVDDLFIDVMEGKLSRQGSLRGIPHKKAVLEAFRSMENITSNISSYDFAESQLTDFAKVNKVKNAQTYLSEYPYLPTTDPSKYHSRLDAKASGLISLKELMEKKPRRNSVPDLRLNPKFTVDL